MTVVPMVIPGPAAAQSLLGALFGWGEAPSRPRAPEHAPLANSRAARLPERDFDAVSARKQSERRTGGEGGSYQTLCVRTCDGFYWPLHYPVAKGDIKADAALCQATCGAETKLYTRADPGVEAEEMADSEGKSYGASPTAFAYRRGLTNGCTCRAMPWSDGERARHEAYALIEEERKLRAEQAEAERVAAVAALARAATDWGMDAAVATMRSREAEALAVALLTGGPSDRGPAVGRLEQELLLTRRDLGANVASQAPDVASDAEAQPAEPAVMAPASRGRRFTGEGAAQRPGQQARRVRVVATRPGHHKPGLLAWMAGPSKFTYPGDPPGR